MNLLRRSWQRPWVRRCVWMLFLPAALIALLWGWVNWSGARRWSKVQARLAMEGQTLDFRATAPDPIPDDQNYCANPLLKDIALVIDDDPKKGEPGQKRERLNAACLMSSGANGESPKLASAALGQRADLQQWVDWMRNNGSPLTPGNTGDAARDFLSAFTQEEALYSALAGGLDRPESQWSPAWKTSHLPRVLTEIPLPHFQTAQDLNRTLDLRCAAAVSAGDARLGHESALIIARLTQACQKEPFLL